MATGGETSNCADPLAVREFQNATDLPTVPTPHFVDLVSSLIYDCVLPENATATYRTRF